MATPDMTREPPLLTDEESGLKDINADYTERYGFHDAENYLYKAPKGLTRELVEKISRVQERAAVDARLPPEVARPLPRAPDADVGLADARRGRLRQHPLLRARVRARRALLGRRPRRRQEDVRPARHPRGRAPVPGRRRRAVRVRSRLPPGQQGARGPGRDLPGHGHGAARARGHRARVLRDDHPVQRQQARRAQQRRVVGRLVRLRAAGRPRRDAAAGLLPHQHGEHGPVRAHADHRRRGLLRSLRRGLHRADVLERLAALRGRRADRQARRADPLHDRPELVAERLQPRHQARGRPGARDGRVGRLQPRLEAHDEVPERLPDGRGGARRDPVDRLRRQGPAPGRGRQDHPRRAAHDVEHLRQVDLQGRRALQLPRPARGRQGRRTARSRRSSATRCCSTRTAARTPTRRSASARTTSTSATRRPSPRSATSSSST